MHSVRRLSPSRAAAEARELASSPLACDRHNDYADSTGVGDMKYALVLIGAHNGSKSKRLVDKAASLGPVLLVEPVPWLFDSLQRMHGDNPAITLVNAAVVDEEVDRVSFFAPTPQATRVANFGDQLGSLNPLHAGSVHKAFESVIEEIIVPAISLPSLIFKFGISEIESFFTDTEGFDAKIISTFPFDKMKPHHIVFEFMHSDGTFNIGANLAHLLLILSANGYKTKVLNGDDCWASLQIQDRQQDDPLGWGLLRP